MHFHHILWLLLIVFEVNLAHAQTQKNDGTVKLPGGRKISFSDIENNTSAEAFDEFAWNKHIDSIEQEIVVELHVNKEYQEYLELNPKQIAEIAVLNKPILAIVEKEGQALLKYLEERNEKENITFEQLSDASKRKMEAFEKKILGLVKETEAKIRRLIGKDKWDKKFRTLVLRKAKFVRFGAEALTHPLELAAISGLTDTEFENVRQSSIEITQKLSKEIELLRRSATSKMLGGSPNALRQDIDWILDFQNKQESEK